MKLKPDELRMLNGEEGRLRQEAMKFLVRLGEAYGAEEMVDIKFSFAYTFVLVQDLDPDLLPPILDRRLLEEYIAEGKTVKIPTIGGLDGEDPDIWKEMGVPEKVHNTYLKDREMECKLGIQRVGSCTPYMVVDMNTPALGTHMITIESSAIPFYNSVLGARCERCGVSALLAAITGKYPAIGYHLDENRYATVRINVKCDLKNMTDFGCLGQFAGEFCGMDVPVFRGIKSATNPDLIAFSCAIATGGAVSLFHIPGITAEFRTEEEALNGKEPAREIDFTQEDLDKIYARFNACDGEKIDTVFIGCPHLNIYQMKDVSEKLKAKKKPEDLLFIMNTNPSTKRMAEQMGYVDIIRDAGAMLISGTCPIIGNGIPGPVYTYTHPEYTTGTFATNSLKAAAYAKSTMGAKRVVLGSTEECIDAAISGVWRKKR